jgi:spore coat protein U-like protein
MPPHNFCRFRYLVACLPFGLLLSVSTARAQDPQCTFKVTAISFGTVDVKNGRPYDATGVLSYACTGNAREIIRMCPSFGIPSSGSRFMTDNAGHKLLYDLYTDEARTSVWGTWFSRKSSAPTIDAPIGRSERVGGDVTVYARLAPGQQEVPPGIYKASISGNDSVTTYDYASKGACIGSIHGPTGHPSLTITARAGGGDPSSQPIVAPDATHPNGASAQSGDQSQRKRGFWQTMADNAAYQQDKQNRAAADTDSRRGGSSSATKPLCKMSDPDVHLVNGTWAGPNCIAVDASGNPVTKQQKQPTEAEDQQANRAEYIEAHSCMTTMGAEEANALADDCTKTTQAPHSACNIQQNTCDEIRDATQRACNGLGSQAPDFCLTRYR